MNRCYPGRPNGWFTEQVAGAISPLCKDVDFLIDWHGGGYGTAINYVLLSREEGELGEEIHRMGRVYGLKLMYDGAPAGPAAAYAGTLTDYMISLGKPAIVAEVGTGICLPMDIVKTSVRGVFNVMKYKGMIEGKPEVEHDQYLVKDRPLLRPHNGGMFYPLAGPEMLNGTVPKGTPIAEIRNVRTMEVIETMYAPCEETAFLMLRGLMTKVHPATTPTYWPTFPPRNTTLTTDICHRSIARRGGSFPGHVAGEGTRPAVFSGKTRIRRP